MDFDPGFLADGVVGAQLARQVPEMLASVIEIDDLHGAGEVLVGQIPYPFGSVTHDNFLCRAAPATVPGFQIDALSKLFGSFDGSCISSRIRISNGIAFFIPGSLGERRLCHSRSGFDYLYRSHR